jgi:hypothetical protein
MTKPPFKLAACEKQIADLRRRMAELETTPVSGFMQSSELRSKMLRTLEAWEAHRKQLLDTIQ